MNENKKQRTENEPKNIKVHILRKVQGPNFKFRLIINTTRTHGNEGNFTIRGSTNQGLHAHNLFEVTKDKSYHILTSRRSLALDSKGMTLRIEDLEARNPRLRPRNWFFIKLLVLFYFFWVMLFQYSLYNSNQNMLGWFFP